MDTTRSAQEWMRTPQRCTRVRAMVSPVVGGFLGQHFQPIYPLHTIQARPTGRHQS